MADFTWVPDQALKQSKKFAVLKASFGDGYEQRAADGINNIKQVWDLAFTLRTKTEIEAIDAFLEGKKGVSSFTWVTFRGATLRFKCDQFSTSYNHDGDCSASAVFEQVFET